MVLAYTQPDPSSTIPFPHLRDPAALLDIDDPLAHLIYTFVKRLLEIHVLRHSRHGVTEGREMDRRGGVGIWIRPDLDPKSAEMDFEMGRAYDHLVYWT